MSTEKKTTSTDAKKTAAKPGKASSSNKVAKPGHKNPESQYEEKDES